MRKRKQKARVESFTLKIKGHIKGKSKPLHYVLEQRLSKWNSVTSILTIIWELIKDAHSKASPRPNESETLRVGPRNLCFKKPCRWPKFESHLLDCRVEAVLERAGKVNGYQWGWGSLGIWRLIERSWEFHEQESDSSDWQFMTIKLTAVQVEIA